MFPAAREHAPGSRQRQVIWPSLMLFYALILPPEMHVALGTLNIWAYRLVLILLVPWLLVELTRGKIRLGFVDVTILFTGAWMLLSLTVVYGGGQGLESGGALAFDLLGSYFTGRCFLRSERAFKWFLKGALPGFVVVAICLAAESITGDLFVRPLARSALGAVGGGYATFETEFRYGFARALGPFSHSILAGLIMTSCIPLYLLSFKRSGTKVSGTAAGFAGLFSFSSAAYLVSLLNIGLVSAEHLRRKVRDLSWNLIILAIASMMTIVHVMSQNGIGYVILRYLTFSRQTGYHRLRIWEFGSQSVVAHPWWGIGFEEWERPAWLVSGSVDAHWLYLAMVHGLPAAASLGLGTIAAIWGLGHKSGKVAPAGSRGIRIALSVSLATLSVAMFTVTLFGSSPAWFALLLGAAAGIARGRLRRPANVARKIEYPARDRSMLRLDWRREEGGQAVR